MIREHLGQPFPRERLPIVASHSCPNLSIHQIFSSLPAVNCSGLRLPFFVIFHCATSLGLVVFKSLKPIKTLCPEQMGQPLFLDLSLIEEDHSWSNLSIHQTFLRLPAVNCSGLRLPFFVIFHCATSLGLVVKRSLKPIRIL